jgi:transcriptional regulator with XRE-family HTH domain
VPDTSAISAPDDHALVTRDHHGRSPRLAILLGAQLREERLRQRLSLRHVGARAGLSAAMVQSMERGRPGSLLSYESVAEGLGVDIEANVVDRRRRQRPTGQDGLHGAIGEVQARHLRPHAFEVFIDEPYQHDQFAGRADLIAVDRARGAFLHAENRTRFPNVQEAVGAFNAKRSYLAVIIARRLGIPPFTSITHVMVVAWTGEAMHELRRHRATFASVCPDSPDLFGAWWDGTPPTRSGTALVLFDPTASSRQRPFVGLDALDRVRPRYRGYAEMLAAVSSKL